MQSFTLPTMYLIQSSYLPAIGMLTVLVAPLTLSATNLTPPEPGAAGMTDYTPPADSGWINVKTDLGAKGNGIHDDTEAFANFKPENKHDSGTFYFPNGTYLLSDTLYLGNKRVIFHGESREGVIIKLKANSPGFGDADKPKPFISTHGPFMDPKSNMGQAFKNSFHNLTIEVERGNEGAVALHYLNNNQGMIENVTIRSEDGKGKAGLGLVTKWPGPALIKNVTIEGFDYGIWSLIGQFSLTFEDIILKDQREAGVFNRAQALFIRRLFSDNKVPAIINQDPTTNIVLVDSVLEGGDRNETAIQSWQMVPNKRWEEGAMTPGLFIRNVHVSGYEHAIVSKGGGEEEVIDGPVVKEFSSRPPQRLIASGRTSLNLPWEDAPRVELGDSSGWTSIRNFTPTERTFTDDRGKTKTMKDWGPALQQAIDSGAEVIYFPKDTYEVASTVEIRGKLKALMGLDARLTTPHWPDETVPLFRIGKDAPPVLLVDRLNDNYGNVRIRYSHEAPTTLIMKNSMGGRYRNTVPGGKVFIYDVVGSNWEFNDQQVWARQLNTEAKTEKRPWTFNVRCSGGKTAILGVKTEYGGTVLHATNRAQVEVLGGWSYHTGDVGYIDENSQVTLAGLLTSNGFFREALVREIEGSRQKDLSPAIGRDQQNLDGSFRKYGTLLPLYLGH
jgi:hypothetical protein